MTITPAVLRPSQAATYIGMSVPSFWRYAKLDPNFPQPFKIGPNATAVMRADLDAWLKSKREAA
ncbi:helix-turn-helix transcriptional regulator [Castellaniella ginsengisoli]